MMVVLNFEDCWGGSAKAHVADGFYSIIPVGSEYQAKKSDGKVWVWDGGLFATNAEAEKACLDFEKGLSDGG